MILLGYDQTTKHKQRTEGSGMVERGKAKRELTPLSLRLSQCGEMFLGSVEKTYSAEHMRRTQPRHGGEAFGVGRVCVANQTRHRYHA
jgi:hypothetical protein